MRTNVENEEYLCNGNANFKSQVWFFATLLMYNSLNPQLSGDVQDMRRSKDDSMYKM